MGADDPRVIEPFWCVLANVKPEPFGADATAGTKHFSAGTKLYCAPAQWGDGYENIFVVGRHRGSGQLVGLVMNSSYLTNWRAKLVYSRAVRDALARAPHCPRAWSEQEAREAAAALSARSTSVADPQRVGRLVTAACRAIDRDAVLADLERQAIEAMAAWSDDAWSGDPQGPPALQVLADALETLGARPPYDALKSAIERRARRRRNRRGRTV